MACNLSHIFIVLLHICSIITAVPAEGRPPGPAEPPADPIIRTTTNSGSTYTLTYAPSTLTAATTITDGPTTASIDAGVAVAVLAGEAAVAAEIALAPKILPEPLEPGDGGPAPEPEEPEEPKCEVKTASKCTDDCVADWSISECHAHSTTSCSQKAWSATSACDVEPSTTTVSHGPPKVSVATITNDPEPVNTSPPISPAESGMVQAFLAKAYFKLGIDWKDRSLDTKAECETGSAKGVLQPTALEASIDHFCKSNDGGTASPNNGRLLTYDQDEDRVQAVLNVMYSGERGQGAIHIIKENTCKSAFGEISKCRVDDTGTSGGNYTQDTGVYSIEPYIHQGDLTCAPDDAKFGLQRDEAVENISAFCKKHNGKILKDVHEEKDLYFQKFGGLLNTVAFKEAPDSVACGEVEDDPSHVINEAACKRFLTKAIDECNKDQVDFKAGGTVADQCVTYSITPSSREQLICNSDHNNQESRDPMNLYFNRDGALDAIQAFCDRNLELKPDAKEKSIGGFSQNGDYGKGIAKGAGNGTTIEVIYKDDYCTEPDTPAKNAFKTGGRDCMRILKDRIIDACDEGADQKRGGHVTVAGGYGCVQWRLGSYGYNDTLYASDGR